MAHYGEFDEEGHRDTNELSHIVLSECKLVSHIGWDNVPI